MYQSMDHYYYLAVKLICLLTGFLTVLIGLIIISFCEKIELHMFGIFMVALGSFVMGVGIYEIQE